MSLESVLENLSVSESIGFDESMPTDIEDFAIALLTSSDFYHDAQEAFLERSGIVEFEGGLSRYLANKTALLHVITTIIPPKP